MKLASYMENNGSSCCDWQALVNADRDLLCRLLHRSRHEVELIQSACQRSVDDRDDYREAVSLLKLVKKDSPNTAAANDDADLPEKRKRRK